MIPLTYAMLCLTMTIYNEARSESVVEQEIVAHVVMNRVEDRNKSVCEVVTEKNQFSWVKKGKAPIPKEKDALMKAQNIAWKVYKRKSDPANGANHFWANHYQGKPFKPHWAKSCAWKRTYGKTTICEIPSRFAEAGQRSS